MYNATMYDLHARWDARKSCEGVWNRAFEGHSLMWHTHDENFTVRSWHSVAINSCSSPAGVDRRGFVALCAMTVFVVHHADHTGLPD